MGRTGKAKIVAKQESNQQKMKDWVSGLNPEQQRNLHKVFYGTPNGSLGLKDIMFGVYRNYINYLDSNPSAKPVPINLIGKEIMAVYNFYKMLLKESRFTEQAKPIFITEELRLATQKPFRTPPKQVRGEKINELVTKMYFELGKERFISSRLIDLKNHALANHNVVISEKSISRNTVYINIRSHIILEAKDKYCESISPAKFEI